MGPEGLLFFWPIFRSAFTHTHTNRFPLFVALSLAGGGNRTTEGSTLASSSIGRLVCCVPGYPTPTERITGLYLLTPEFSFGLRAQRLLGVAGFICLLMNLGFIDEGFE